MNPAPPATLLIVGTFFLGLIASLLWPLTKHLITMTHEGAHAMMGSLTGGQVVSVKMNRDGTGETVWQGTNGFLATLAGYAGPSVFGLAGATMLAHGVQPDLVLWVSFILIAIVFLQMRNVFGFLAVFAAGFLFYLVVRYGTVGGRTVFAYAWVWFLLLGGFIHTVQYNLRRNGWSADAVSLRDMTNLPRGFWGMLWWLVTLAALVYGGGVLLGLIDPLLSDG
jgi:peptidase M50B-like protein